MVRKNKRTVIALLVLSCSCLGILLAQSYSDAALLNEGNKAWQDDRCVRAARFFFAYLVKNPSAGNRADLQKGIDWCEANTTLYAGGKGDNPSQPARTPKPSPFIL